MMSISSPAGRRLAEALALTDECEARLENFIRDGGYDDARLRMDCCHARHALGEAAREAGKELVAAGFHRMEGD